VTAMDYWPPNSFPATPGAKCESERAVVSVQGLGDPGVGPLRTFRAEAREGKADLLEASKRLEPMMIEEALEAGGSMWALRTAIGRTMRVVRTRSASLRYCWDRFRR